MRDTVVSYIEGLDLGVFSLAYELPFDSSGTPLYQKNLKRVYVGMEQTQTEPFIQVMNAADILLDTTIVFVYLATDAKTLPTGYSDAVTKLSAVAAIDSAKQYFRKQADITTEFVNDIQVTSIELRFSRINNT